MTRIGKIARLPREIRGQLNRRLQDGEPGRQLVAWLNALPDVQAVLRRDFDGRPINEPNLTDWKQGGYCEWVTRQEVLTQAAEMAADAEELAEVTQGRMADHLAMVLTARYAAELAACNGEQGDELRRRLRALRELCHDVVELQRGSHNAARVKIEQARLDRDREKAEEDVVEVFLRWIDFPKVRDHVFGEAASLEDRKARLLELFSRKPDPAANPPGGLFPDPGANPK